MWQSQITTGRAARSDVTYLELLHWEAAVDVRPEELAKPAGDRFRG
jgi:galactose-1-phosphate uridylyltransferase